MVILIMRELLLPDFVFIFNFEQIFTHRCGGSIVKLNTGWFWIIAFVSSLIRTWRHISLQILSKLINSSLPLKSSENLWFSNDLRGNKS